MKLTLEQDEVMNGIVSDLDMMGRGYDPITGDILTREDMIRLADGAGIVLVELWNEIACDHRGEDDGGA